LFLNFELQFSRRAFFQKGKRSSLKFKFLFIWQNIIQTSLVLAMTGYCLINNVLALFGKIFLITFFVPLFTNITEQKIII